MLPSKFDISQKMSWDHAVICIRQNFAKRDVLSEFKLLTLHFRWNSIWFVTGSSSAYEIFPNNFCYRSAQEMNDVYMPKQNYNSNPSFSVYQVDIMNEKSLTCYCQPPEECFTTADKQSVCYSNTGCFHSIIDESGTPFESFGCFKNNSDHYLMTCVVKETSNFRILCCQDEDFCNQKKPLVGKAGRGECRLGYPFSLTSRPVWVLLLYCSGVSHEKHTTRLPLGGFWPQSLNKMSL